MGKFLLGYFLGSAIAVISLAYHLENSMSLVKHNDDYFLKDTNIHIVDTLEVINGVDTTYVYNLRCVKENEKSSL